MNSLTNNEINMDLAKQIGKQEVLTEELENLKETSSEFDEEDVQGWLSVFLKAVFSALK